MPSSLLDRVAADVYHCGVPGARLYWTLVFTPASVAHLSERGIDADDVAEAVFGHYGPARVRRGGRRTGERWFIVGPSAGGALMTCVFRAAQPRDLETQGAFVIPAPGRRGGPGRPSGAMRLCVSARVADADETRSYRAWRQRKGGA